MQLSGAAPCRAIASEQHSPERLTPHRHVAHRYTTLHSRHFGLRPGRGHHSWQVGASPPSGATPQFFGESAEDPKKVALPKIDLSKVDFSKVDLSKIPKVQLDDQQKEALQEVLDTSTLGKRGEGWVVGGIIVFGLLLVPPRGIELFVQCLGLGLAVYGLLQWFLGLTNLGIHNISPFATPRKNNRLTTSGIYKYVRHPQYGGTLLIAFGLAIATGDAARFALATLLLFIIEEKVKLEEASLKLAHPEVYEEYVTLKPRPQKYIPIFY